MILLFCVKSEIEHIFSDMGFMNIKNTVKSTEKLYAQSDEIR